MNKFRTYILSSVMFLIIASVASAGTVQIDGRVTFDPQIIAVKITADTGAATDPVDQSERVGIFKINTINPLGTGESVPVPTFGFCIDLPQGMPPYLTVYELKDLADAPTPWDAMGDTKAAQVGELWFNHYDANWESFEDEVGAGVFQIALWEIIYEKDGETLDATSGDGFSTSDAAIGAAANLLLASITSDGSGDATSLTALCNTNYQDFVTVPEPATMAILALGGLGIFRRKKS